VSSHRITTSAPRGEVGPGAEPSRDPDVIGGRLSDASGRTGRAEALFRPESEADVAAILRRAAREGIAVTVQAARTSTTASSVPEGGWLLSTERLRTIHPIDSARQTVKAEPGAILADLQREVEQQGWLYPPDPTSRHDCSVGGTIACNASGARTFAYGATRRWVRGLRVVLATGEVLDLERGRVVSSADDRFEIASASGDTRALPAPRLAVPRADKHAAGYASAPGLDLVDLFIGSEGTLGIVSEAELQLTALPERCLGLLIFFPNQETARRFVVAARREGRSGGDVTPRCIEWFDAAALELMRRETPQVGVPEAAGAAVFCEQECTASDEDARVEHWLALVEAEGGMLEEVRAATTEAEREGLRAARHAVPVAVNETAARRGMPKVGTDLAVPDEGLAPLMTLYRRAADEPRTLLTCSERDALFTSLGVSPPKSTSPDDPAWAAAKLPDRLETVTFGHVGDNHLHVNFLPGNSAELAFAQAVYDHLTREAIAMGGTPSAEHGIGKIKRGALRALVGERGVARMRAAKAALDPMEILGRGNLFENNADAS